MTSRSRQHCTFHCVTPTSNSKPIVNLQLRYEYSFWSTAKIFYFTQSSCTTNLVKSIDIVQNMYQHYTNTKL